MSLEKLLSRTAQQLLCACISAAVRMSISCCALVIHLLCGKFIYRNASAFFVYVANLFISFCFQRTSYFYNFTVSF